MSGIQFSMISAARSHIGGWAVFWAVGALLCAACTVGCMVLMARAGSMSLGLVTLTLFWGLATARAVQYLLAARRGDAHVGHWH